MISLALPATEPSLQSILSTAVRKAGGASPSLAPDGDVALWRETFFGLGSVKFFQDAPEDIQRAVVSACCQNVLSEALFIEDAGMAYTARMTLLARSEQERLLYALFSADEATHYAWVKDALGDAFSALRPNAFHKLLADSISVHPPEALVFLIQVFLEGWGLQRYGELMRACENQVFRDILRRILQDEARHHGSGVLLNAQGRLLQGLSAGARRDLLDTLCGFLDLVRVGPQSVVQAMEETLGGFSRAQRIQTLNELNAVGHSQTRLDLLKNLLAQERAFDVIAELERHGAFTPLSPEVCS